MPNSSQPIADLQAVLVAGLGTVTKANALKPDGPIMDPIGNIQIALLKLKETEVLLARVESIIDQSGDSTNYGLVHGVTTLLAQAQTVGGGS